MKKLLNRFVVTVFLIAGLVAGAKANPYGFSQAELDQMLAPIALYPDTVLTHVLIAATYPMEVSEAARWSHYNPHYSGEEAVYAVEYMDWDPSVKALVAFPELIQRMGDDMDWTSRLGDAFLMQEDQVMDSIQYLREQAYAGGHLRSNEYVRVVREPRYIYIEPAAPRVVYVPYYDPRVVYAHWRWPAYRPVYWPRPAGLSVSLNFGWGAGIHIAPASFYISAFHWPRRQVVSVHHHHHHYYRSTRKPQWRFHSGRDIVRYDGASRWKHNTHHRRGATYRDGVDRNRFVRQATTRDNTRWRVTEQDRNVQRRAAQRSGNNRSQTSAPASRQQNATRRAESAARTRGQSSARERTSPSASATRERIAPRRSESTAPERTRPSDAASRQQSTPRATPRASNVQPRQTRQAQQPQTRNAPAPSSQRANERNSARETKAQVQRAQPRARAEAPAQRQQAATKQPNPSERARATAPAPRQQTEQSAAQPARNQQPARQARGNSAANRPAQPDARQSNTQRGQDGNARAAQPKRNPQASQRAQRPESRENQSNNARGNDERRDRGESRRK